MATIASKRDISGDLVCVSRAEADLALDRFPSENPFTARAESPNQPEEFDELIIETDAAIPVRAVQVEDGRRRRSGWAWMVAAAVFLATAFVASMPLVRTSSNRVASTAPQPTPPSPAAVDAPQPIASQPELLPPVATPPVAAPPVLTPTAKPRPNVPTKISEPRARATTELPPPATRGKAQPRPTEPIAKEPIPTEPIATRTPADPPRPPSAALDIASGAKPLAAEGIKLGGSVPPPPPTTRPATPTTPPPAAVPPVTASGSTATPPRVPDSTAVQTVLDRYAHAFSQLDASATAAIWPDVDMKALARSFDRLDRQTVAFSGCQIKVSDDLADASCAGQTSYVPKIGRKTERLESHEWTFTLRKMRNGWVITSVRSK